MHEVIKTDRLVLRPLVETDAADFARLVDNWDICRMTGSFPYPFPRPSVEGLVDIFLARAATSHSLHWAITQNGNFTGVVGLYRVKPDWSLGYWLGQSFWGQGYASETVRAISQHVAESDSDSKLLASVFTDNPASAKVLLRAGFEQSETVTDGFSLARRETVPNWNFEYAKRGTDLVKDRSHKIEKQDAMELEA